MKLKIALRTSVDQLRLSKLFSATACVLVASAACAHADIEADQDLAECVGRHYLVQTFALRCDNSPLDDPICVTQHLAGYDNDADRFFEREKMALSWIEDYSAFREFDLLGKTGPFCAAAQREIDESTLIGRSLKGLQ